MQTHQQQLPTPRYTCVIRLPFPRGDFVDPPPVDWDASKDKALWKIISKAANDKDLDWPELSTRFQAPLPFLLQQAAWLYERHFAQMRAQMAKLGASTSAAATTTTGPSSRPESASLTTVPLSGHEPEPTGAGRGQLPRPASRGSRASSAMSMHASTNATSRTIAPAMSRTPSARTVTQSRVHTGQPPSPRESNRSSYRLSFASTRRPTLDATTSQTPSFQGYGTGTAIADLSPPVGSVDSDTDSSSEDDRPRHPSVAKSQIFRRPPGSSMAASPDVVGTSSDDSDSSGGGFLPFAAGHAAEQRPGCHVEDMKREDAQPSSTIRRLPVGQHPGSRTDTADVLARARDQLVAHRETAGMSQRETGSGGPARRQGSVPGSSVATNTQGAADRYQANSLGQVQQALSPRHKAVERMSREGSDGTPSMGSSFSDLEDTSVTRSALEDALLSNMQQGNIASRVSTFSQALKSRYLPQSQP